MGMSVCTYLRKPATCLLTVVLLACSMQGLLSQAVLPALRVPPVCEDHSKEKTFGKFALCGDVVPLTIVRKTVKHLL